METRIRGNRGLMVIAGLIMGAVLGMWIYILEGMFLAYGPAWSVSEIAPVPKEIRMAFLSDACWYGLLPGLIIGFISGLGSPFLTPRGHMAKGIGCTLILIVTPLVWWSQWHNLSYMKNGLIGWAVVVTLMIFLSIIPVSGHIGGLVEPLFKEKMIKTRAEEHNE